VPAVFRLLQALDTFNGSGFPLDPGSGTDHPTSRWAGRFDRRVPAATRLGRKVPMWFASNAPLAKTFA
jgi:hypothetical protein